ncbi:MAG: hypothetical protein KatS3mg026_0794 [Bacteroidia bacterium]|nr:MAG: hypothetical protein KatS3mg026_0794 [Bacteroidia bacterium]
MRYCVGLLLLMQLRLLAQPANDNCQNAALIPIPDGGYGELIGYTTTPVAVHNATSQIGEYYPVGVPNGKSIWYRFFLPTTRTVQILLSQVGNSIPVEKAGWTLYRGDDCLPGASHYVYPPIQTMQGYTHACLRRGWYLIQIGIDNSVTDPSAQLYLSITVRAPDASAGAETAYDHGSTAQNFGTLSTGYYPLLRDVSYEVSCQSVRQGENLCGTDSSWSKSTWHVFRTDGHADWVGLALREEPWNSGNTTPRTFRISLYQGDVRTNDSLSLTPVQTCINRTQTTPGEWLNVEFYCLQPNTWYSIQILYPTDYEGNVRLRLYERGTAPALGYHPTSLPASHQLGSLSGGADVSRTDYWACQAYISANPCPTLAPATPSTIHGYQLALYYTFSLPAAADVDFDHWTPCGGYDMRVRIFSGNSMVDGCNLALVYDQTWPDFTIRCMPAGSYTVQILGGYNPATLWDRCYGVLGYSVSFRLRVTSPPQMNYGLRNRPVDADLYNSGNPLTPGTTYYANRDTIDCGTTLLPAGDVCGSDRDRAIYRIIHIGQDGILEVGGGNWQAFRYRLYRGDARFEPVSGGRIQNLVDQAGCQDTYYPFKVCVTPGIYTLVSLAGPSHVGESDRPWVRLHTFPAGDRRFYDPTAPVVNHPAVGPGPQYVGALQGSTHSLSSSWTRVTCEDNPLTILGYPPCGGATKQFYWEVYIHEPSLVTFSPYENEIAVQGWSSWRTFRGRISDNSLTSLYRDCHWSYTACMEPGWYTFVAYARGGTYANPSYSNHRGLAIGNTIGFNISRNPNVQKYGTFASAHRPGALDWQPHYVYAPHQHRTYTLDWEYWSCANNLPFPPGITSCNSSDNRISYRVFSLTRPSYVIIYQDAWWRFSRSRLYQGDITASSPPYTIVHDCTDGAMYLCWLPPGDYTLVTFASDAHIGETYTPTIYVDSVGYSLHDHAAAAYDFGDIPADNTEYRTRPGDPLGPYGRPGSTDWIFCTTGAVSSDPNAGVCPTGSVNTTPPSDNPPAILPGSRRRNLWYTFTVSDPGQVYVSVYAQTPGTGQQPAFEVYVSDDFNYTPPSQVDSTIPQGLSLVVSSQYPWWCCSQYTTVRFYRDPCNNVPKRYYVVVYRNDCGKQPNIQIEVGIRVEPLPPLFVMYDHYSEANIITGNPTTTCSPPYSGAALPAGTYTGCQGDLTCATKDPTDKNSCGVRTIWYRFTSDITGFVYLNYDRPGVTPADNYRYDADDIQLYYDATPGDPAGLVRIPLTDGHWTHPNLGHRRWGRACVQKGRTYYIMLTGCNHLGYVVPRIWLEEHKADYCQDSLAISFTGLGTQSVTTRIDCFTIGEAPGESNPTIGCLGPPTGMKSAWFLVQNNYSDTLDFNVTIIENTTAVGSQVKYRIMLGDCNIMNPDECVAEGAYVTLHLKCRPPGMPFWVHVILPDWATGTLTLQVEALPATEPCRPPRPECPITRFTADGGCVNTPISFINTSTAGAVTYSWNFGDGNTSTATNPIHTYTSPGTYTVWLKVDNGTCADSTYLYVVISPKPGISVSYPSPVFVGLPFTLTPTYTDLGGHVQYLWNFCAHPGGCDATPSSFVGATPPPIEYSTPGTKRICVTVINDYGLCDSTYCFEVNVLHVPLYGGPYDGASLVYTTCRPVGTGTFWAGGPYDGASLTYISCRPVGTGGSMWTGGPYDGASLTYISCRPIGTGTSFWTGGPYDGASLTYISCRPIGTGTSFWAGGPYDGADAARRADWLLSGQDAFACLGSPATLTSTPHPMQWYTTETGGSPVHTGSSYSTPPLTGPTLLYVQPICGGTGERIPLYAIPLEPASPSMQVSSPTTPPCAGQTPITFTNQTLISGPSQPTVGTLLTGVSTTPGTVGTMTFSSASVLNFAELYDGVNQQGTAWTPANTSGGRPWVEWTYPDLRSVNRIVLYRCQSCPNAGSRSPLRLYLYYHDGTAWVLARTFWLRPSTSGSITGTYDTGTFTETANRFYARWRLELEVNQPMAPPLGELQIYASEPVIGGTAHWSFDGGATWTTGAAVTHTFSTPGNHEVLLTVQSPEHACTDTLRQTIAVENCVPLASVSTTLQGVLLEGRRIQLTWRATHPAQYAILYKLNGLVWQPIYAHRQEGDSTFVWIDENPSLSQPNVYRVESYHPVTQRLLSSNVVEITLTPEDFGEFVRVYPNPTSGTLYVEAGSVTDQTIRIRVYDARGAEVLFMPNLTLPKGIHRFQLNTRSWAAGIYTLRIEGQTRTEDFRVLKLE